MHILLCENIRSTLNVGSIFRTADAVGFEKVLLVGYTPCPIDRMGRENEKMHKTALGAEKTVPWHHYETVGGALQDHQYATPVVIEQTDRATCYTDYALSNPTIFIFGNEVSGVSQDVQKEVPLHLSVPMRGKKESLNVAVCAAVIAYHYAMVSCNKESRGT
ncbi:MAG: TrmH family RNA methyltransferase [Candidatus Kaiserbacteria bacterium]|nr:TrmH family RNA methyltransferase [Candidatus Kaiserbacteria bacterium]